jgi:segregation and condensation protein B
MSEVEQIPELKQILGAMLFAAKEPVSMTQMQHIFAQTAEQYGGITKDFAAVTEDLLKTAIAELNDTLTRSTVGMHIREVANGYRLVNDANCGPWLRILLEKGKATRLSRPALETLAIIAYRQPVIRSEIEAVRGVAVDQIIRNLLDLQLIRVVGRSDLPGRPWLFGTTQKFLEHFGIKSLSDLPGTEELRRLEAEQLKRQAPATEAAADETETQPEPEPAAEESE